MPFFTLNGYELGVAVDTLVEGDGSERESFRSITGQYHQSTSADRRQWEVETPESGIELEVARAFSHLLRPSEAGHVWDGESGPNGIHSTKLLAPVDSSNFSTGSARFGSDGIAVNPVPASLADISGFDEWTVMGWSDHTGSWVHYTERHDSALWVDGTRNDSASMPWTTGNSWDLNKDSANGHSYDDLVLYPFSVPDVWPAEFDRTRRHSKLPDLDLAGNVYHRTPTVVQAEEPPELTKIETVNGLRAMLEVTIQEV